MRVYIAGPMRNKPKFNFPAFDAAEEHLRSLGCTPVSPARMDRAIWDFHGEQELHEGMSVATVLRFDIGVLQTCDAIYMLRGWENSQGAITELALAQAMGIKILFEEGAVQGKVGYIEPTQAPQ